MLNCSFEKHKITKLENHEDKEITVEELVDQYYKDPGGKNLSFHRKKYS